MLNFRNWFERSWIEELPEGKLPVNESGINSFVSSMANLERNATAVTKALMHGEVYDVLYDPQPISHNLLTIYSPRLLDAEGVMTNAVRPIYAFFAGAGGVLEPGSMLIQAPPCYIDNEDKELLRGIITHELRHAVDWINPKIEVEVTGHYAPDVKRYAESLTEARAFASQLESLMERIGNPNKVMQLLKSGGGGPFRMNRELMSYAIDFLKNYKQYREQAEPLFTQPPAIVRPAQESAAAYVAQKIAKIVSSMLFSNFIIDPQGKPVVSPARFRKFF